MEKSVTLIEQTKRFSLFFVEDDKASRDELSQVFNIFFQNTVTAVDGQDGWEKYNKGAFDLVITDIHMPRMDGIQLIKKIKKINPEQKIIIMSAHDTSEHLLPAIQLGVDGFIVKPVEMGQMMDILQKITYGIHNDMIAKNYYKNLENEIRAKTAELQLLAVTDELTGLYNRKKFNQVLMEEGDKILLLINIDNFDNINVSYGYYNGDIILKKIAEFFQANIFSEASLFRLGHDEFAVFCPNNNLSDVLLFAEELKQKIADCPIEHDNITIRFTATIAITQGDSDFLKNAHIALKEARLFGKNRINVYRPNSPFEIFQKEIQRHIPLLFEAIKYDKIIPYFQPIVNNKTKQVEKYEALARLIFEDDIVLPFYFIKAAELSGMLPNITRIMIEKSFKFFEDKPYTFSINIGEQDLNDNYLIPFLETTAQKYGIDRRRVVIEVLEGISVHGTEQNLNQLKELKLIGYKLAIDDFGAQNSNFERVHRLNVDYIKIDGSFIKNIDTDDNSYKISQNITNFAKSIGAKVIAEFVHNESVYQKILELDIEYTQGYYVGEPKPTCGKEDLCYL